MTARRTFAALFALCLSALTAVTPDVSAAQERVTLGWGRMFTNDAIGDGHDRWRTGAYTVSRLRGESWSGDLPALADGILEFRFRAETIAPQDLVTPSATDRRYAGVLAFGLHSHFDYSGLESTVGLDVVVTGPQTGMARLQSRLHNALGLPEPQVLGNQIADDAHIAIGGEVARRFSLSQSAGLRPYLSARVGEETMIRAGADLTIGHFMQDSLMLRETVSGHLYRGAAGDRVNGVTLVAGADVARVFDSIYLPDGGVAELEPWRARARTGIYWQGERADFFSGLTWLGKEFGTQPHPQVVGSLSLNIKF